MVRPVQCPECGEINSVEVPGEKALKGVGDGPLYSGEVFGINIELQADGQAYFNCNWCDEELSIIYNEKREENYSISRRQSRQDIKHLNLATIVR